MQLYACIVDNSCYILLCITIFQSSLMITDDGLDLCNVPSLRLVSGLPFSFTTEVGTSDVTLLGTQQCSATAVDGWLLLWMCD